MDTIRREVVEGRVIHCTLSIFMASKVCRIRGLWHRLRGVLVHACMWFYGRQEVLHDWNNDTTGGLYTLQHGPRCYVTLYCHRSRLSSVRVHFHDSSGTLVSASKSEAVAFAQSCSRDKASAFGECIW